MNRKALGKGIHALIPDFEIGVPQSSGAGAGEILIDEIVPNKLQPRKFFDNEKLEELVQSIQEKGVLQPVIVQKGKGNTYELIVGERRWRAGKKAGLKKIPAIIRDVSDTESLEIAIIENIHRQDLNPIEEAEAYTQLAKEFGLTQEKLAKRIGKSRAAIANTVRLLNLPQGVKEEMVAGRLSMGHARALLGLDSPKEMDALKREILQKELNVRQTEGRVKQQKSTASLKAPQKKKNLFLKNLETDLGRRLGTKVDISPRKKGGTVVITYYSNDDLERIRNMIVKKIN